MRNSLLPIVESVVIPRAAAEQALKALDISQALLESAHSMHHPDVLMAFNHLRTALTESTGLDLPSLDLPTRTLNLLLREGIHTIASLTSLTAKQLLRVDGLGPLTVVELSTILANKGYALKR